MVICAPINRDFLNRRLSVQAVKLKERLQQLDNLYTANNESSSGGSEDSGLLQTCEALQNIVHTFILSLVDYVSDQNYL